ncbi:MAG: hypothetical protein ACFNUH_06975 [Bacteroidota bacterium]|jgi:hypothetical protein
MKATNHFTPYILIQSNTNSEWDTSRFAIIHTNKAFISTLQQWQIHLQQMENELLFYSIELYCSNVEFYQKNAQAEEILQDKVWTFVELAKEELGSLILTENRLICHKLHLCKGGRAYFAAYGKHTDEDFWTEEFTITEVI